MMLTADSELALMKINLKLIENTGKKFSNKADIINASIMIASECMDFMDIESIKNIIK